MSSTLGQLFRISTWGESHGPGVGVVIDGCPPRVAIALADIQGELDRRRPGQSRITSHRTEADQVEILSGVQDGLTLGTPIALLVRNADARAGDYAEMRSKFRPSHADYTYQAKYGIRAVEGGGRASARETVGRVAAGAVAQKMLAELAGIEIVAYVQRVGDVVAEIGRDVTRAQVEATMVRCPDPSAAQAMIDLIDAVRKAGDSVGGVIEAVARKVPAGLGEPVFDRLEADLGKALLSLPACKGFESGSGFAGTRMRGSQHNDAFFSEGGRVRTRTNWSGGIQGGISNGEDVVVRAAFKPTATVLLSQETVDVEGNATTLQARGRHDPCVLPRAVPVVEAMMALVLADHWLRQRGQCGMR
ncbi:MAG: chorismate synthase [Polyangia bacterium]